MGKKAFAACVCDQTGGKAQQSNNNQGAPNYTFIDHIVASADIASSSQAVGYTALPTKAPIPAVKAIARAPQNTTLIVGRRIAAPPVLAPIMPSSARKTNEPTETAGSSQDCGAEQR